jgi:uncharacterized protein (DUF2252 family)
MPKAGSHGPEERAAVLERQRRLKMARSAHAYVRGNTVRFYEWLDGLARGTLPEGPPVWICGDCHLGNLGPLADADGHVDIQATRRTTSSASGCRWRAPRGAQTCQA